MFASTTIMSAFETVNKLVREWEPRMLPTELAYQASLTRLLREHLPKAKVETEYRHCGTTVDIYVKQPGIFVSSEVFIELKRNLLQKAHLDRLVGQIESLQPGKNAIIVIRCGETNPALVTRFEEKYEIRDGTLTIYGEPMTVVVKEVGGKFAKS